MDLKKIAGQAGQFLTRAVQYTEEKFGGAEKTEYDGHFETLAAQADTTRQWTEKLVSGTEAVVIPNPGNRVEDMLFEKIEKRRPNRLSNVEYLGLDMVQAGNDFGSGTAYGTALLKVGPAMQKLGMTEREFVGSAVTSYLQPLKRFLDTEMKSIQRERRLLETKRLDLDACKSRLRKARNMDAQQAAEADLRKAQNDFDRQTEITKLLLEGVRSSHASQLRCLNELVEVQAEYYEKCHLVMQSLQQELASVQLSSDAVLSSSPAPAPANPILVKPTECVENGKRLENGRKAKVVIDYSAADSTEIDLTMGTIVTFIDTETSSEFVQVESEGKRGCVPRAYLEPLDA